MLSIKQRAVNKIARILQGQPRLRGTPRDVAKEIAAAIPLAPDNVWILATEVENTGRDEQAFASEEAVWEDAGELLESWMDGDFNDDGDEEFDRVSGEIYSLLEGGKVEKAIEMWNDYQDRCCDNNALIFVFKVPLNGVHISVPSKPR